MQYRILFFIILTMIPGAFTLSAKTTDTTDEKELSIELQLKAINPSLLTTFQRATDALANDDYEAADSLFSLVLKDAPAFDPALRRRGISLVCMNKVNDSRNSILEGIKLCEQAVKISRSAENLSSLARCLAFSGYDTTLTRSDTRLAVDLVREAILLPDKDELYLYNLMAEIGIRLEDKNIIRDALKVLTDKYPNSMRTHYYAAILASWNRSWLKAEEEILKAEKLGLSHMTVRRFLESGIREKARVWHYAIYLLWAVAVWAAGLILLYVIGKLLSMLTLRSMHSANPQNKVNTSERLLRRIYGAVINFAGIYYYISLPVIVILFLVIAGRLIYAVWVSGHVLVGFVLIAGVVITIYSLILSLVVKIKYEALGRALTYEEAPELWNLTKKIASDINTRPVDEIRITCGIDMAVSESGTWREKMNDKGRRILILGVGNLSGFKQGDFCAVLAHEYGHFTHRDTAGGDIAIRVQEEMNKFLIALYNGRQATWWNIVFHFLRLYGFIFRRISYGAARLQEVLADRIAAGTYGTEAFRSGLTHVIRQAIEFSFCADKEIEEAIKLKRPIQNLYELTYESAEQIESELEKVLNCKTKEDDTHPSPVERFRLIEALGTRAGMNDSGFVWDLFIDKETLTKEMTALVENNLDRTAEEAEKKKESSME